MTATNNFVPSSARWLGALGAVPFLGLAGVTPFLSDVPRTAVVHALAAYGAVILSFLGGIHWGLAIADPGGTTSGTLRARLILSVMPSLMGWVALLVPARSGLFLLAAAVATMLWVDIRATRLGQAPSWYPRLRVPLTCVVVATLLLGASR